MKTSLTYLKNHLVCFGAAVLLLVSVTAAKAQILLNIQISGDVATITATGTLSQANAETSVNNGIDLLGFFTSSTGTFQTSPVSLSSNLTAANLAGTPSDYYDTAVVDDYSTTDVDLTLYSSASGDTQVFSTTSTALTGTLTVDLSGLSSFVPTSGSGEIVAGYSGAHPGDTIAANTPIGEWQVVSPTVAAPEPSTWALLLLGITVILAYRVRAWKFHIRG